MPFFNALLRLFDEFAVKFEKKGFVLLGFFEAGFTYIFSKKPIAGLELIGVDYLRGALEALKLC